MRLTILAWLMVLARLTIYGNRPVLSLPQSLIGNTASLRQQQLQEQSSQSVSAHSWQDMPRHRPWKKDTLFVDGRRGAIQSMVERGQEDPWIAQFQSQEKSINNKKVRHKIKNANQGRSTENKAEKPEFVSNGGAGGGDGRLSNKYDLNTLLVKAKLNEDPMPQIRAIKLNVPFTPLKYWSRLCQTEKNCPTVYYRNLLEDRNKAAALKQRWDDFKQTDNGYYAAGFDAFNDNADMNLAPYDGETSSTDDDNNQDNNDVFLMLTGEQDLKMFLNWAMSQLYTFNKFSNNNRSLEGDFVGDNSAAADDYYSGMYLWRKSHLSGRLEPKMLVDEPHYKLVRKYLWPDQLSDESMASNYNKDIPFIPPRGRKHDNLPDLDSLLNRYETFVPNRGKRDKIKDILKYDDLFYPNRGKKKRTNRTSKTTSIDTTGCLTTTADNRVCGDNHNDN